MYSRFAHYYDALYRALGKDYAAEARKLREMEARHRQSPGNALLDVCCGTGGHLVHLQEAYRVEGLDCSPEMLEIARRRLPEVPLHLADMTDFHLDRRFDVVACLFSSIGYAKTLPALRRAVERMAGHLEPGGLLLVEPWLDPQAYMPGVPWATLVDEPDLKLVRMNVGALEDGVSVLDFHFLVATPAGVEHFTERHELGLYTREQYEEAVLGAGLEPIHESEEITGRGVLLGRRPL